MQSGLSRAASSSVPEATGLHCRCPRCPAARWRSRTSRGGRAAGACGATRAGTRPGRGKSLQSWGWRGRRAPAALLRRCPDLDISLPMTLSFIHSVFLISCNSCCKPRTQPSMETFHDCVAAQLPPACRLRRRPPAAARLAPHAGRLMKKLTTLPTSPAVSCPPAACKELGSSAPPLAATWRAAHSACGHGGRGQRDAYRGQRGARGAGKKQRPTGPSRQPIGAAAVGAQI